MSAAFGAAGTELPVMVDPAELRTVARRLPTGVTVVTAGRGAAVHGMTVNSFTTVSLAPALVSFSVRAGARVLGLVGDGGGFVVNLLSAEQAGLARRFSDPDRLTGAAGFAGVDLLDEATAGGVALAGAVGYFVCDTERFVRAGDHVVVLGSVLRCATLRDTPPLVFEGGGFHALGAAVPG
ncbi:flavin reductase family protein [Streptomyces sp. NPDC047869]|uniref:flavin reductase family protein n=1 Tax=Streptomyces sp. NPDC047869 TaxID=3154709 RepID=UPI0034515FDB